MLVQALMPETGKETVLLNVSIVGLDGLIVRIGSRPSVDIVVFEVGVVEISLAVLNLRRAISSAVCREAEDVIEEGMLARLALRSM